MPATYKNYVDWNNTGVFTDTGDDVSARSLDERTPIQIRYGRDQVRQLSPTSDGTMGYELNNVSRDYSPENTSSPLNGQIFPGRQVLFQAIFSAVTYTMFTGYLDDFNLNPDLEQYSINVTCTDGLGRLQGVEVSTALYGGVRTGEAIGYLLDAAGWPAALRDLDVGASILPWWWVDSGDAFAELMKIVDSEGPAALVTVDTSGNIVFRDRHHRLTRSASLTSQSTWRAIGTEPLISSPAKYEHGFKEIINSVSFDVDVRSALGTIGVLWTQAGTVSVGSGETIQFAAKATTPFTGLIVPADGVDFTTQSGLVTIALSRTSGQSTVISVTGTGGPAVIADLQLRGYGLADAATIQITYEDPASVAKYGYKAYDNTRAPVWASRYDAFAIAQLIIGKRAERVPTITVTMKAANATRLLQQLTRDLSDRVHVIEPHTGLDSDCYIEQIAHTVTQGGTEHTTSFGLERIPMVVTNPFTFDVAGKGFNDGLFGQVGQDDPTTMFRFDTSGQGFDQGFFAN